MVWEVRKTTGSDSNGGGFVAGGAGTDYSQQASPQYALTGLTTSGASATIASASASTDMVDNTIQITGGTNFTAGIYRIVSVVAGTSITVDRTCTTGSGSAGTGNVGGALKTIDKLSGNWVGSNSAYVKAEATYTTAATVLHSPGNVTPATTVPYTRLIGYTSTRGDGGQATIQCTTGSVTLLSTNSDGFSIENLILDCNSQSSTTGFNNNGSHYSRVLNCVVKNFTVNGINCGNGSTLIINCEVTGGVTGATAGINIGSASAAICGNNIHDNACSGVNSAANGTFVVSNLITNNSGTTSDGVIVSGLNPVIMDNTIYKSGRHGINNNSTFNIAPLMWGNVLSENGGYGIKGGSAAGIPAQASLDGNAYYSNASGTRNNMDDTSTNAINGVAPYTNSRDVILTADPFVAKASNNYALNTTAGGGAACRAAGMPRSWPNSSISSYVDMGAAQHQDAGGSSSSPNVGIRSGGRL